MRHQKTDVYVGGARPLVKGDRIHSLADSALNRVRGRVLGPHDDGDRLQPGPCKARRRA
eukprot:gene378-28058_t